ncbi:hypothetical protein EWM64_g1870 [Hericium alpestre]|uniref:DDE-1 domain-containing protein n=1 Tax=Hericium alpestre TaxID=135208 RepID=A0A4Z0A553_9AGAM|nr:hypothetical protein EWM64_g1870 [Hericium alpestre]
MTGADFDARTLMLGNAEYQIWQLFLRLALLLRDAGIRHPHLIANFDQTQVTVADNSGCTFEVEGSKQVAVANKEEKRAWTAVVGITAAGNVLPTQIVMKGGLARSLPSPNSPGYAESKELGLLFGLNAKNYWSNIPLLEEYLEKIVTSHFSAQKQRLGYPEDQECVVLLDCWSVHRSEEFRNLVRRRWPWLRLRYIPGGCTGLAQPCDVGIQRPYKLSIKRSQLDDIISKTLIHLESNDDPTELKLDSRIGTLRDRSVAWFVKAWKEISQVDLVKKSFEHCAVRGGFNLSFESLTSSAALKVLRELPQTDPVLWAKISSESVSESDNAEAVPNMELAEDEDPFADDADDDGDETALEPSVFMAQILSEPVSADCLPGAADTLDLEEVQIPDAEEFGRGKRRKTANKKYRGFEYH